MARGAAFQFKRAVFIDERPLFVSVAFYTGSIGSNRKFGLLVLKTAVWIVTIAAIHRAFQNAMSERFAELCLDLAMASDA